MRSSQSQSDSGAVLTLPFLCMRAEMPLSIPCDKVQEVGIGGWGRAGTCALCSCWWQMQPGIVESSGQCSDLQLEQGLALAVMANHSLLLC